MKWGYLTEYTDQRLHTAINIYPLRVGLVPSVCQDGELVGAKRRLICHRAVVGVAEHLSLDNTRALYGRVQHQSLIDANHLPWP